MARKASMDKQPLTQDQVAEHLDLSCERLRTLIRKGVLPIWDRKSVDLEHYRAAYIRWLRGVASGHNSQDGNLDLTLERAKLTRAQTEKTEIEVAHLRGESLPRSLVSQVWQMHAAAVRSRFLGLASKLRMLIPKLTQEEGEMIDGVVCEILEELSGDGLPASASKAVGRHLQSIQTAAKA
jgi:phage terminase Nu1 subunit (DNA packaging protein)